MDTVHTDGRLPQIVQCMTTEHFTLQTARAATVQDANGRTNLFVGTVSSVVVALAFIGQVSNLGGAFCVFAFVLLPLLLVLGIVTFVRVMQSTIEDMMYARGIARIRHFYIDLAPQTRPYYILSTNDDIVGGLRNMGIRPTVWQFFATTASVVSVINGAITGVIAGLVAHRLFAAPVPGAALLGSALFLASVAIQAGYHVAQWRRNEAAVPIMFPTGE